MCVVKIIRCMREGKLVTRGNGPAPRALASSRSHGTESSGEGTAWRILQTVKREISPEGDSKKLFHCF